ncbi:receptor-like protein 54 [Cryptomeria japonica]|uniref:receptor-like protein 54 n=1 Tax=Cryptomeria japonica TaxID=3369 RepID=UPI0027DA7B93|nr:receptor-like protein 54 [Cryptomeria japonica]
MALTTKLFLFTVIVILRSCSGCIHREGEALLQFKASLNHSSADLSSWEKGGDCCLWDGISCHHTTHHVVGLEIQGGAFPGMEGGVISESLCTLTFVASISLTNIGLKGTLPPCLTNLSSLTLLDLSYNMLSGSIPLSSSLAVLYLAHNFFEGETVLSLICMLSDLSVVDLSYNQLNGSLPSCLGSLSSLTQLDLSYNRLSGNIPLSSSLAVLHLSSNNLEGETVLSTLCMLSNLTEVDLSYNQLNGSLPSCLGNLSSLIRLDIPGNHLSGKIPYSLGNLSSLKYFDVSNNSLSGSIPDSLGSLSLLETLDLSYNQLTGTLPSSFSRLTSLLQLFANGNVFNQSIAPSALPSSLIYLHLSFDGHQIISEAFIDNLSKLDSLALSNCVLNISTAWIPSFQLFFLYITSCKMDRQIPPFISTQFSLSKLELSNNDLVGEIPSWLLDMRILYINLTMNHLEGQLLLNTSAWSPLEVLDVSRNAICGQVPSVWPPHIKVVLLNDNLLTGNIPPQLHGISSIEVLNLANNHLNGIIPPSLANCSNLQNLNLGDNNFRGMIPYEFGKLSELKSLLIKNNQLTGSLPPSISNCTDLYFLDVGQNFFKGHISKSIGNLSKLKVLAMRKNNFGGSIPAEIGQLKSLQILDLSSNRLSGLVPDSIFSLQAMLAERNQEFSKVQLQIGESSYFTPYTYVNGLTMNSKGRDEKYTYIFPTMAAIDLSNNQLNGNLPFDLGKLKGLKLLNLSMNSFSGAIPSSIVQMTWLETLDLSTNNFSGQIPPDLGSLSYLGAINFSNNQLSGSIPQGGHMATFGESSYSGNPNLWGCPLPKKCSWPEFVPGPPISTPLNEEEQNEESVGYDLGLGLSYVAGFTVVLVFIVLRRKWGQIYFQGVDLVLKTVFPWLQNLTL